jgi:stearoyl-CoA desaturase (delta-9 desaturase)
MVTAEWVAIHRKHHASADVEGDPHSPVVLGIKKVFFEGAELYRKSANDRALVEKYSYGTPNDWIERNVYSRFAKLGISLMLVLDVVLFGLPGISIWAIQMLWIPLWAAGVINGIGHHWGYRNYECDDAATNLIPWGFWIGGEELHNNHHTFASSAKFSVKWWEFDLGWFYIRCLSLLGLAKVKKLPPELIEDMNKTQVDLDTVKAVITNRFQVMSEYYQRVVQPILQMHKQECAQDKQAHALLTSAELLLKRREELLSPSALNRLKHVLTSYEQLRLVYNYRQSLQNVWKKSVTSQKDLVEALQAWCQQAEDSGFEVLRQFSEQIKRYVPQSKAAMA